MGEDCNTCMEMEIYCWSGQWWVEVLLRMFPVDFVDSALCIGVAHRGRCQVNLRFINKLTAGKVCASLLAALMRLPH